MVCVCVCVCWCDNSPFPISSDFRCLQTSFKEFIKSNGVRADVNVTATFQINCQQRIRGNWALFHLMDGRGVSCDSHAINHEHEHTYTHHEVLLPLRT